MSRRVAHHGRTRWWALMILCLGCVMVVIDGAIITVALPSIQIDLGFSESSLVWVVNAYVLTFSGFLLLGGRLGDLYGHRPVFLAGIIVFALASLSCALSWSQLSFIVGRAVQGIGGAVASAAAGAQSLRLFTETGDRARATGVSGFIMSTGGILGILLGGLITSVLNWHWLFLINIPIGAAVCVMALVLLPEPDESPTTRHLDIAGALAVTASLMLAVYGTLNGHQGVWIGTQTVIPFAASIALMILFLSLEARAPAPLVPLRLFRGSGVALANTAGALFCAAMSAWTFMTTLYLQLVVGYTPLQVAFAFLPADALIAAFSLGLSVVLVTRVGIKLPLVTGLLLVVVGFLIFSRSSVRGNLAADVLPGMLMIGLGSGMASTPLSLASVAGIPVNEAGLAAGLMSTTFTVGGALGLAVLVSVADARTEGLRNARMGAIAALNGGYHAGFLIAAVSVCVAAGLAMALPRVDHGAAQGTQRSSASGASSHIITGGSE